MYQDFSTKHERDLALILGKITHHIHPDIVHFIEASNKTFRNVFTKIMHCNCNVDAFLYANSDCVFPGFRRPIYSEKRPGWKNSICLEDGTLLNDNTIPRHIWAYLTENRAYAGGQFGMWTRSGLNKFELAHVFAHKKAERTLEQKVFEEISDQLEPYGLFASASNVVLIPKGFAKPTDQMANIKICFYKRHLELYGCNLIGLSGFKESMLPDWYSEIEWMDPILPEDWSTKLENLLIYREKYLSNKYAQ